MTELLVELVVKGWSRKGRGREGRVNMYYHDFYQYYNLNVAQSYERRYLVQVIADKKNRRREGGGG